MQVRSAAAWFLSALAHLLLLVALYQWRLPSGPAPPAGPDNQIDIAIEVRPPGDLPPVTRPPAPPRPKAALAAERSSSPARDHGGDRAAVAPAAPLDLSLGALSREARARVAAAPPEATIAAGPHRLSVDELLAESDRAEAGAANVRAGRVDPLLYDYLRGARTRFEEEARRQADAIALGPSETVRGWGRGYLARIDDAHRGVGNEARAQDDAGERRPDVLGGYDQAARAAEAGAVERRLEVCLDVAPGRETRAALRRGSGNAALDRVALAAFIDAVAARPVPPDARTGRACYEVRIAAHRAPPLPFLSCGFDRSGVTCIWPFKKVTSVTGRLVSVEYPDRGPRSLLRPPR
jgi:hypothetical protein